MTVVSCDMREWVAPEKADIIVSELLGSFGDNELSPECLDGAQNFLKGRWGRRRSHSNCSHLQLVDIEIILLIKISIKIEIFDSYTYHGH